MRKTAKRLSAILTALALTLSLMAMGASAAGKRTQTFTDVPLDAPYYEDVEKAREYGLMNGVGSGRFDPTSEITRAMWATMLYQLAGSPAAQGKGFPDVAPGDWFSAAAAWITEQNIAEGYPDGRFGGSDTVTRQQLALMAARYAQACKAADLSEGADLSAYGDGSSVAGWATQAMAWAMGTGLLQPVNGRALPDESVTRSEAAGIIVRLKELPDGVNTLAAQSFPETPATDIDPLDQFGAYYEGLWEGTLDTGRTYKIYVPQGARRDASAYFLAVPDGMRTDTFLLLSGWIDIANRDLVDLFIFEPANQKWGSAEEEAAYFADTYNQFNGTTYVYHDIFNWRWVGYGSGAEMMQRYLLVNPMIISGAVFVDGSSNITSGELQTIGATQYKVNGNAVDVTYGETPAPVWIISETLDAGTNGVIDYWKRANDVTDYNVQQLADGVQYNQNPFSSSIFTYDQKVGTVRVTEQDCTYTDPDLTEAAYDFVTLYARSGTGSPYSNSLTRSVPDSTFIRHEEVIDGYQREWYVYVPSSYSESSDPLPMVIYYHGTGQSGLLSMRQGDWWKLAEEKNFIAVCPSGTLEKVRAAGKVPQMSWNVEDYGNADDIVFTRELISYMAAHYRVDLGRVYATGQSNGGRMSIYAGLALPRMITAVGSAGASALTTGATPTEYFLPKELDESCIVPFMATMGEYDMFNFDLTDETSDSYLRCNYFCNRYGLDYNDRISYQNGRNTHTLWLNNQGVPLQEQVVIGLRAHSHRPFENRMIWDEWFAYFSRDPETGTLYYMGREVSS